MFEEKELLNWQNPEKMSTIVEVFLNAAEHNGERVFSLDEDLSLTYEEAKISIVALASEIKPSVEGLDVALLVGNGSIFLITYLAVLYCGGRPALINPVIPTKVGRKLLEELKPSIVITDHDQPFASDALIIDTDKIKSLKVSNNKVDCHKASSDEIATYFYSGGTTGIPKRVIYTHKKMLAAAARMAWGWPVNDGEVWLPIAPFTHIYGFLMGVCCPLQSASSIIMPVKFHPELVLELIEKHKVTVLGGGPPAIYQALLADEKFEKRDLSSLHTCPGGGAPFPIAVHQQWEKATKLKIFEGYGMTEIAPISVNTQKYGQKLGSAGKSVPDTDIEIVDVDTGVQLMPAGEAGEIRVRGPHMMAGYCNNPTETKQILRDGWVYTGDIGEIDAEGFLTITDRKKDLIIFNGFNVFPREVEEAVLMNPLVASVCVVGLPNERSGEIVVALLTLKKTSEISVAEIIRHCKEHLVAYKIPKTVLIIEKMPLTPAGKIDKMVMRALAQELIAN